MKMYGSAGGVPRMLVLGPVWRWVVNFTTWTLYAPWKRPCADWTGGWLEKRKIFTRANNRHPIPWWSSMHLNQYTQLLRILQLRYFIEIQWKILAEKAKERSVSSSGYLFTILYFTLQSEDGLCLVETCNCVNKENCFDRLQTVIFLIRRPTVLYATHKWHCDLYVNYPDPMLRLQWLK